MKLLVEICQGRKAIKRQSSSINSWIRKIKTCLRSELELLLNFKLHTKLPSAALRMPNILHCLTWVPLTRVRTEFHNSIATRKGMKRPLSKLDLSLWTTRMWSWVLLTLLYKQAIGICWKLLLDTGSMEAKGWAFKLLLQHRQKLAQSHLELLLTSSSKDTRQRLLPIGIRELQSVTDWDLRRYLYCWMLLTKCS